MHGGYLITGFLGHGMVFLIIFKHIYLRNMPFCFVIVTIIVALGFSYATNRRLKTQHFSLYKILYGYIKKQSKKKPKRKSQK